MLHACITDCCVHPALLCMCTYQQQACPTTLAVTPKQLAIFTMGNQRLTDQGDVSAFVSALDVVGTPGVCVCVACPR